MTHLMQRQQATRVSRVAVAFLLVVSLLGFGPDAVAADVPEGTILMVAPHPDDDVLLASGITSQSSNVTVVYLTNGEYCEGLHAGNSGYCKKAVPSIGTIRQNEAVDAQVTYLNRVEDDLIFLGYPTIYLEDVYFYYSAGETFTTPTGRSATFASRGLGSTDYHSYRTGSPAAYNGANMLADMVALIDTLRPDHVYTTGPFDRHTDHQTSYRLTVDAIETVAASDPTYRPTLHSTIVHVIPQAYWGAWPEAPDPTEYLTPIPELKLTTGGTLHWEDRDSYEVPAAMQSTDLASNPKYLAIEAHASQNDPEQVADAGYIRQFLHRDEIFWSESMPNSSDPSSGADDTYPAFVEEGGTAVVDAIGVLDNDTPGHLGDAMTAELVSDVLHGDLLLSSDGSFTYDHDGSETTTDAFVYRPMQGSIAGSIAKVELAIVPVNDPPIADAGGPYQAGVGASVQFDGSASHDADGTITVYEWDFGDGSTGTGKTPTHTFTAEATFNVTLTVTDNGGETDVDTTTAATTPPPVAVSGGPYSGEPGIGMAFDGSGSYDTDATIVAYEWDFGDGSTGTGETPTHIYTAEGTYDVALTVTNNKGARHTDPTTAAITTAGGHSTGLVDPGSGQWYLFDDAGTLTTSFYYGNPGDYPFMGDWDGDGVETPGLYRQSDGYVYLRNSNTVGVADIKFFFGNPGDVPIAGDFNNDGFDTVSIYRPSNQTFYIINKLGSGDQGLGAADFSYVFGNPGDKPFVGDFDGDGIETVGLHRESTGLVYFRNSHTQGNADAQFIFGDPGDRLIAGDWTDDGVFTPALFRPSNTTMYFRYTNTQGNADNQFIPTPTNPAWLPVSGKTG